VRTSQKTGGQIQKTDRRSLTEARETTDGEAGQQKAQSTRRRCGHKRDCKEDEEKLKTCVIRSAYPTTSETLERE